MGEARAHVALLVDFANLRQQLSGDGTAEAAAQPEGRDIARSLVKYAGGVGRVGVARAYADWSREPELARSLTGTRLEPVLVPATDDGEDRSHIRLTVDAMAALLNGDEPDAFVLVSSDPSLVPLVQALRADGSEVTVVATDEAQAVELCAEADQFVPFQQVLEGLCGEPLVLRPSRDHAAKRVSPLLTKAAAAPRVRAVSSPFGDAPSGAGADFTDYDWTSFIKLIDELEQRLPFVGVRYLVNKVLGPHNCGIDDPRVKRDLINEAVDEGLIEMYTVGNVNERTDPVTACRLDRENEAVLDVLGPVADDLLDQDLEADLGDDLDQDLVEAETGADEFSTSAP